MLQHKGRAVKKWARNSQYIALCSVRATSDNFDCSRQIHFYIETAKTVNVVFDSESAAVDAGYPV